MPNDPDGGPWRTDPRRWSTGHPGDHAAARLVGPVPRDRVTPPCCGRGSVTRSFSCRSAGGRDRTGSSTGHTGHRSTAASMVRRRAELVWSPLAGSGCHELHRAARDEHVSAGRALTAAHSARTHGRRAVWSVCGVMWVSGGHGGQRLVSSGSGSGWPRDGFVRGDAWVSALPVHTLNP